MKLSAEISALKKLSPCSAGFGYARSKPSLYLAWDECEEPTWLLWYARRKSLISKEIAVRIACFAAREVLPIFEKRRPDDKRPRLAIEAAEAWISHPCAETRAAAYAAYAAYAAAYAAAAADAAVDAAAADAAAYAAAAAADAYAAAAAAAAAADAASARKKMKIKICTFIRSLIPNQFAE